MNKYTLQLKNKKIRQQYEAEDLQILKIHIRNIAIVLTITVVAQMIIFIIHGTSNYKIYLYFSLYLVGILTTYLVSKFFLRFLRIFHSLNVLLFASLILWSFVDSELKQSIENEKSLTPFVRGIFLCTQFFILNISSYFPFQALMYVYLIVLLLSAASQNPLVDALKLIPMLIALIQKGYYEDKGKKRRFLLQKKDDIWDHLTNELLPTSLIVVKWDKQSNRIEFYSQNKQAQKVFKIQNTEDFNEFSRKFVLEEINDKIERKRSLRKSEIKWEDTLLFQIQNKIEREKCIFDNCEEPQLLSDKDLSENNFFRKFAQTINLDNTYKKSVSTATLTNRKALSPKSKINMMGDTYNLKQEKQFLGKIDYFLGEHRHQNFEISDEHDRYSVRLGAYFLNEWYGVISIENESFRDRYIQQKNQYLKLSKQVNQNYEYLLHCSRLNIKNIRDLHQKFVCSNGAQQKGQARYKNIGQIQQEINLNNYFCDRSSASETQNSFNEPIKECSSYLENRSPITNNKQRQNFHQNHSLPHKSSDQKEENLQNEQSLKIKHLYKQRHSNSPPPTFGSDYFHANSNNFKNSYSDQNQNFSNQHEQIFEGSSPKNFNINLFTKQNRKKSSILISSENQKNIKSNFVVFSDLNAPVPNNKSNDDNFNSNSNFVYNLNQLQATSHQTNQINKNIELLNDASITPKSQKQLNSPYFKLSNEYQFESTKPIYTAILMKIVLLNQMLKATKVNKQNNQHAEGEKVKSHKKSSLKQVVQNITSLFRYSLSDKGSNISITYDENLPNNINQDQSKLTQILFNSLHLMVINTQPTHELQLHISSHACLSEGELITPLSNQDFINNNNKIVLDLNKNQEKEKHERNTTQENDRNQVIKFTIKSRLIDAITSKVPKFKDLNISIFENGFEQVFAKSAIPACQKIIQEIGPYSAIKLQFDPTDCTFQITYCVYQDLGVLIKSQNVSKTNIKNKNNAINLTPLNYNQFTSNNAGRRNTQNTVPRDRMESNLHKSYNINQSEENFLKTKDLNFNQIVSKQVNRRTIQILENFIPINNPQQETLNQIKTNNNFLNSPTNQIESSSMNQNVVFQLKNFQDKQFQKILKKYTPSFSLGLIDGNALPLSNQKEKQQELNSSQEISQNQQRSLINHNSVSNIIQQHTNLTID
ncbi:transmembrane protein, putative (macronuclear) [Tetrahymena thermophila SB210]|uniref:Transmembrane protein, putative n=1 Tax=Tetrahymena thermophila (strain SB210) TaxID=312017 RepID=Q22Y02_TETTS|nr:transmembrane protein, putative [Tetrahymena thermophila SB210]EAR90222.2 transmembrane protein, putative [Tetrahymena thermophila SB210]|eukprot:XP_001010467.2 transmembrane protein, putative [Tetrahymena thermophila SB210]